MIRLAATIAAGGVVVFPSDTVYGLACDPRDPLAVERLYALKGRAQDKPAALMYFHPDAVNLDVGPRTQRVLDALLPGPVTLLLPNPSGRFPLACGTGEDAIETIGLRVPDLPGVAYMRPILQTSANFAGEPDARRLEDVPEAIREGADLAIDGGELPGTPSTVIDLRRFETTGEWEVVREGALSRAAVAQVVGPLA
jgi:L-threonylcarbamoyladenylate synthase